MPVRCPSYVIEGRRTGRPPVSIPQEAALGYPNISLSTSWLFTPVLRGSKDLLYPTEAAVWPY